MPQDYGPAIDDQALLAGMGGMIEGGPLPPDATGVPSNEGAEGDVVAALALENVQLRSLLGLGPNDPIPDLPEQAQAGAPQGPPVAAPEAPAGLPAF